jgi:CDGSH-type Zn-finger protein
MRFDHAGDMAHPLVTRLEPGTYYFCMCGKSRTPPFCDGSHMGSEHSPLAFVVDEMRDVALCSCGLTRTPPFCDGSHRDY